LRGPTEVEALLRDVMQAVQAQMFARVVTEISAVDLAVEAAL
jgi:hypothetical protein